MTVRRPLLAALPALLACLFALPLVAGALPASSVPATVAATGFEPSDVSMHAVVPFDSQQTAVWGKVVGQGLGGGTALWCAGDLAGGGSSSFWPFYPSKSFSWVYLDVPAADTYFSLQPSLWYRMPSVDADDLFQAAVGSAGESSYDVDPPVSADWTRLDLDASGRSRLPLRMQMNFADKATPAVPTWVGPLIDDILVTGYTYGPVRALSATGPAGAVQLAWQTPYRSLTETVAEERPLSYRVWRSIAGADAFSELSAARIGVQSIVDTTAAEGTTYDYFVQAWDTGTGARYGEPVQLRHTVPSPGAPVVAPTVQISVPSSSVGTATVSLSTTPGSRAVGSIQYQLGLATQTAPATQTVAGAATTVFVATPGAYTIRAVAYDVSGTASPARVATFTVLPAAASPATVGRVAGADRYATAVGIARAGWTVSADVTHVVLANGETGKEADPLAAAGLAGAYDAPVVLTQTARLPAATRSYLTQVGAARKAAGKTLSVHIVGGTASVPDARWNEIRAIPGISPTKDRVAGADRYATTVAIANRIVTKKGIGSVNGILIINAENPAAFYDALAASPIAFARTMPILGVKAGSVPASVRNALSVGPLAAETDRYVVSAPSYVSATVYSQVKGTRRLTSKVDRYAAAADISTQGLGLGMNAASVGVASVLPDALTGGALLGKRRGVMLFTAPSTLSPSTRSWLVANKSSVRAVTLLGGTASVSESVRTSIVSALK